MRSIVPLSYLLVTLVSPCAVANEFSAYRLGNYNKAVESLMSHSDKSAVAQYYLGRIYLYGYGQLKNNQLAIRYFTQSAQKGYLPAIQFMARYFLLRKDTEQAFFWFKKAADAGDLDGQMFTAAAYMYGIGVKKNSDMATHYYIDAAKNGNAIAQFTLADEFIHSRNASNQKLGLIWLNKSVANGNLNALTTLATLYIEGKLLSHDEEKGVEILKQAVAQNFAPAMIALAKWNVTQHKKEEALEWLNKAGSQNNNAIYLEIAHVFLEEKSPVYDPHNAFLWTLKAAQNGSIQAKRELSEMYQKGKSVEANPTLAKQWLSQANQEEKSKNQEAALAQAALWLSNGVSDKIEQTAFQMNGILNTWQNANVLGDGIYNEVPQIKKITRHSIFKPQFELVKPNDVPITSFYNALLRDSFGFSASQWTYPLYPFNKQLASLERANSLVLNHSNLPAPHIDANYYKDDNYLEANLMDLWTPGWQAQLNYMSLFNSMYSRAVLGDAQSQFEIGQMFQYGLGVAQSDSSAEIFYQNAAQQQHLGAEYNLGILYLQHAKDKNDYQLALNDLTDSAFKGNNRAQYVLARIFSQGITGKDGVVYIKPDLEQAVPMLYLAAANSYGPAEYELADRLAHQNENNLSTSIRKHKIAMIRQLYQNAVERGVSEALLPLAFYNAMDEDKQRQNQAFLVAKEQAKDNKDAALLLGLLYDRGIGVAPDTLQAIAWYKKAEKNAVSEFILGTYAAEGKLIQKDLNSAMEQLQGSANHQFSYANFNLSVLQKQKGEGFLPNLIHAYELGNNHAGLVLADYYLADNSDAQKMKEAKQIYSGLAEKGDQYAQVKLAYMLENGLGAAPSLPEAQRWYTASAEQGNALAQYLLGRFYQLGEAGDPDYELAKKWYTQAATVLSEASVALGFVAETTSDNYGQALADYEKAALKGNALGQFNLALIYLYGKGVPVDYKKAKELLLAAANQEMPEAMSLLGTIYFNGLGLIRDTQQASAWYQKAAGLGNSDALYQLGLLSETGVQAPANFNEAFKYYQNSADKGNDKAMLAVARMYHFGLGVPKDPKKAAEIYQKLAARQNSYAQYQLGSYYLEGTAGEQSVAKGKLLLQQASDNGSEQARKALQQLAAKNQTNVSLKTPR